MRSSVACATFSESESLLDSTEIVLKLRVFEIVLYLTIRYGRAGLVHRHLRKMLARAGAQEPDKLTQVMVAQRDSAFALAGAR